MVVALLILVPAAALAVWTFFRFTPARGERKAVFRFNLGALLVALGLAVAWGVRTYAVMSPTVDSAWWPIISLLGALVIVPLVLGLAAIARNLFTSGWQGRR